MLGMNGQGVGELEDAFVPINVDNREDISAIKYGSHICLKSMFAKERYVIDVTGFLRYI